MADYNSKYKGKEIDDLLDLVHNADNAPTTGSTNLVKSGGVKTALDGKVDKETGKGLSTEDFTTAEKNKLDALPTNSELETDLGAKADKVDGATADNFAALDANGNLKDSGHKHSDYASASQGAKADTAYQKPSGGIPKTDLASGVQTSLYKADAAAPQSSTYTMTEMDTALASKANKDTSAVKDNLAKMDGEGNAVDSGLKVEDVALRGSNDENGLAGFAGELVDLDAVGDEEELNGLKAYEGEDGVGVVKGMKGKTRAWNQNIPTNAQVSFIGSGLTITANGDGSFTLNGTVSGGGYAFVAYTFISGHKYYLTWGNRNSGILVSDGVTEGAYGIIVVGGSSSDNRTYITFPNTITFSNEKVYPQVFDLTLMYGAGKEPNSATEFQREYPAPYYPYNSGILLSNTAKSIEITGRNVWDEEWESGYYTEEGVDYADNHAIRSKNFSPVIPNAPYYFHKSYSGRIYFYDANKTLLGRTASMSTDGEVVTPSNCHYIKFFVFADNIANYTYNHDICINLSDASFNGTYVPHKQSVLNLNLDAIKVKSPNIWDEEWIEGYWGGAAGAAPTFNAPPSGSGYLSCKNIVSVKGGVTYYFNIPNVTARLYELDAAGNVIKESYFSAGEYTTSASCCGIVFSLWNTSSYANNITVNVSQAGINGNYFPYGILTIEGGLKSASSVYDEIKDGKLYRRVGRQDLGDLSWSSSGETGLYFTTDVDCSANPSTSNVAHFACSRLVPTAYGEVDGVNEIGSLTVDGTTYVRAFGSQAFSQLSDFVADMQGVYLDYELANEQVFELAFPLSPCFKVFEGGTLNLIADTPSVPFIGEISYQEKKASDSLAENGIAEGIADSTSAGTPQEFTFRKAGGDGVNYMKRIKGNTKAWNQLEPEESIHYQGTLANREGTMLGDVPYVSGHKYLMKWNAPTNLSQVYFQTDSSYPVGTCYATEGAKIVTSEYTFSSSGFIFNASGDSVTLDVYCLIIDLTLLFGAGNEPTSVAAFEALYPNAYYPYNAGELKNNDAKALETRGFNQWDEEWEVGGFNYTNGQPEADTDRIRAKNFIDVMPNTNYYIKSSVGGGGLLFCDENGQYINGVAAQAFADGVSFTTPAGCRKMKFWTYANYGNVYRNDICVSVSGSRNGQYEPFWTRKVKFNLDHFKVRGKDGKVITVNGLKSASSVYDEIDPVRRKYIKRVGQVDLGTLEWSFTAGATGYSLYFANVSGIKKSGQATLARFIQTSSYLDVRQEAGLAWVHDTYQQVALSAADGAYSSASAFRTAMNGVYMNYELETPIEYDLVTDIPNAILCDEDGTEKAIFPESANGSPSAPFKEDANYSISVAKLLAALNG